MLYNLVNNMFNLKVINWLCNRAYLHLLYGIYPDKNSVCSGANQDAGICFARKVR